MLGRMATLGEVMTRDVLSVEPSDTIGEAAEKMTQLGVGAVVVSDFGRMIGIFTERDLMRESLDSVPVSSFPIVDPNPDSGEHAVIDAGGAVDDVIVGNDALGGCEPQQIQQQSGCRRQYCECDDFVDDVRDRKAPPGTAEIAQGVGKDRSDRGHCCCSHRLRRSHSNLEA